MAGRSVTGKRAVENEQPGEFSAVATTTIAPAPSGDWTMMMPEDGDATPNPHSSFGSPPLSVPLKPLCNVRILSLAFQTTHPVAATE